MPLYEYDCASCGPFRDWRGMADYSKPAKCPECGKRSPRSMATPSLGMDWQQKKAHTNNERSAHEPRVVHRHRGGPMGHDAHRDLTEARTGKGDHHHGHDHGHGHSHGSSGKKGKLKRSSHPWAVRH
jgi:putative FmdB family regulatory protein